MRLQLESEGGATTLVCLDAAAGEGARMSLAGSRADGTDVRVLYEFQCRQANERIPLRFEPGLSLTILDVSEVDFGEARLRLMESLGESRLRPQPAGIADQASRPTILL